MPHYHTHKLETIHNLESSNNKNELKNEKLAGVSDEELIKNEKKMKGLTLVFAGVLIVLFVTTILLTIKKGFSPLIATPIALLPLLIVSLNNWNEWKKEIKARNL